METPNQPEPTEELTRMLPPPPGCFQDREDLIKHVRDFGANQGYVVTIKKSRKDRRVILGCDRGGVYRNRRKIEESKHKRKTTSRLINCPFEAIGKKEGDVWVLTIKNGDHNHEPLKDMSEHPYSRRFTEEEVRQIKQMTEAGIKPRQVLKTLKESNPELQSTPRHLYNLKAKIRQGNLSDKTFKSWRPNRSILVEANNSSSDGSLNQNYQPTKVPNFIGGKFVDSQSCAVVDVTNPATQEIVSQIPLTTYEEFKAAVSAAKQSFPSWKNTPITTRQRIMFKLQGLIHREIDNLALNITTEQGKTLKGARGDVLLGLEMVEHACGIANQQMGEFVPNACNGIDTYSIREPLGVCAAICPINFPAMTPLWMFPIAVTCGNTFILKPCEKNPGASMILAALATEAGLPDGVFNIVHGTDEIVNYICDDEDIKAVSFLGPVTAGMHIYAKAAASGKRVQSNAGCINHVVVMPDASLDVTLDALVSSGFGAAGERCTALNTAVFVGGSRRWEEELVHHAKVLRVNAGTDPGADLSPVISKEEKERIYRLVQNAVEDGARLLLDGRHIVVPGYENGNFVGPTILCDVTTNMECYKEEIFGPVLLCMQADNLDEAISIINENRNRKGASIFTTSDMDARKFQSVVEAEMVGINVPVPIPSPFSSDGSDSSFASNFNCCGKTGVLFYTQIKKVAQRWKDFPRLAVTPTACPSERVSSQQLAPQTMPMESETESPTYEVQLAINDADIQNTDMSSASPSTDKDIGSQDVSQVLPLTSVRDVSDHDMSLVLSSASQRDFPSDGLSGAKTSHCNESSLTTSQRSEMITESSERSHLSASMMNINRSKTSQRAYTAATASKLGQISEGDDNIIPVSNMSKSIGETYERNDLLFPTSERIYMPAKSHGTDINLGPTSERAFMPPMVQYMPTSSESLYIPTNSQRVYNQNSKPNNFIE